MSDAFYKSSFFRNYLTLMWDGDASHGSQAFTSRDNIRRRKKQWIVNCIYRRLRKVRHDLTPMRENWRILQ